MNNKDSQEICEHMEEYADEYETAISNDSHRIVSYKEPILGLPIIPKKVKLLSHEKFLQDVVLVTQTGIHDTCEIDCGDPCHQDGCVIRTKQKTRHWTDHGWASGGGCITTQSPVLITQT